MWIEATENPLVCRWPGGEVRLEPGKPIELPDERAKRLLNKAPEKVRVCPPPMQLGDWISWTRGDGSVQTGIVDLIHVDDNGTRWAFCTQGGTWAAVNLKFVKGADA